MKHPNQKSLVQIARERISHYGADKAEVRHLLAGILDGDVPKKTVEMLADIPLRELSKMTVEEICQYNGLGPTEALRITLAFELGRRCLSENMDDAAVVKSPEDAVNLLKDMQLLEQEHFRVVLLNTKNKVIKVLEVGIGTISQVIISPRETFKLAVRQNASSIIVAHNHPSGDPTPSPEDIQITKRLVEAGKIMGITVIDHIIIGSSCWTSMKSKGLI